MRSTLGLAETARRTNVFLCVRVIFQGVPVTPPSSSTSPAPIAEARKALRRVEIEVTLVHDPRQSEEVLQCQSINQSINQLINRFVNQTIDNF